MPTKTAGVTHEPAPFRRGQGSPDIGNEWPQAIDNTSPIAAARLCLFGARAQPGNRPVFREHAQLEHPGDIAETAQSLRILLLPPRHVELADRADLEHAVADQANAGAVAGTAERFRAAKAADGEDRVGKQPDLVRSSVSFFWFTLNR